MATGSNPSIAITTDYEMTDDELQEFFHLDPADFLPREQKDEEGGRGKEGQNDSQLINPKDADDFYHFRDLLEIPDYLSCKSNNNKIFEKMVEEKISHARTSINLEQLRSIAILLHQLNILEWEKSLWNHYLQSGMGTLIPSNEVPNFKVWPTNVKTKIQLSQRATTISEIHQIRVTDNRCVLFVTNYLHEINTKQHQLRQQLAAQKKQIYGYTIMIDEILQTFIQEHLKSLSLQYGYKMKLVEFNYHDHLFDYKFQQQQPRPQQIEFIKELFHRKYDYEKAKQDTLCIKQPYLQEKKLLQSLETIQIPLPSSIQALRDIELRERLTARHQQIVQHYKHEMMNLFIDLIDAKFHQCEKLFNNEIAQMWQNQRTLPPHERFTSTMITLIERHLLMIAEKVQYIYRYKNIQTTASTTTTATH